MRFSKSGFFHESIVPILPRFKPLNIFENIFVFAEIFTKVVFQFPSNNTLKLKISRYCYPEIDPAFLPFVKLSNFWVLLPGKLTISKWQYSEIENVQVLLPGNWSSNQHFCLFVNFRVLLPGSQILQPKLENFNF